MKSFFFSAVALWGYMSVGFFAFAAVILVQHYGSEVVKFVLLKYVGPGLGQDTSFLS